MTTNQVCPFDGAIVFNQSLLRASAFVPAPNKLFSMSQPVVIKNEKIDVEPSTSSPASKGDKVEPPSPSSPGGQRRMVPACAICAADSTGIHFGVDACAACSAFFRRTVVLNKQYGCNRSGNCNVSRSADGSPGQKCRACRFTKCITVGMDKNAVQLRRDAIGKYSSAVKRECSPDPFESTQKSLSPASPKIARVEPTMMNELMERHSALMQKRRIFYANKGCQELFDSDDLEICELNDFEECMYQLWRIEPRLAADYLESNRFLTRLPAKEKVKLFRNFVILRQAVEEPFLTWKFGGLEKNWWIMPNRIYIDIDNADKYWKSGTFKNLNLSYLDAKGLFEESFKAAMSTIGEAMKRHQLSEMEMVALCGIVLLDPTVATLTKESRTVIWNLRDQLLRELYSYYEGLDTNEDPEIRLANLLMITASVKVHAIKTSENMHILNTFQLIAKDKMFEDICRGNVYEQDETPS